MRQEQAKLAVIDDSPTLGPIQRLELLAALQTTLALDNLLELFRRQIRPWIPHEGLCYRNEEAGIAIELGRKGPHRCAYRLTLEGKDLGELSLLRRRRFCEPELASFESLLCCLIYPLRNALLYRQALQSTYTDPLTGLYNRAAWQQACVREWKLARRQGTPLAILVLDLDYFKRINDTYGHAAGDQVLIRVAGCLRKTVRASDMIFRYGGEEFVILLSNTCLDGAELLAQRLRLAINAIDCADIAPDLKITASIGVAALALLQEETPEELLRRADEALYQAKRGGRNRVVVALGDKSQGTDRRGAPDTT
ncbi:GGDEF domain-containing protein [Methylothermus subterraneus]|nr:diguanylate cyclase [uncultured Gammaproteobacteria bacterium]